MAEPASQSSFVEIDGSYLEGGGQALRNALSLSCILGRAVRIIKIRANRPKPGLSHQHLHGLNLLRDITKADVTGNTLLSTVVEFTPRTLAAGLYKVDTHTAASVTLVYQLALPVLLFGGKASRLDITGGTNVAFAPPVEFMQHVLMPNLQRFGIEFDLKVLKYGFFPRGNGRCVLDIKPLSRLKAIQLNSFGRLQTVRGWSFCAGRLPKSIAVDMQQTAQREIHSLWPDCTCNIQAQKHTPEKARDDGAGLTLTAHTDSGCVLGVASVGEKRIDGHGLGSDAACELGGYIKNGLCVDAHMQDQLIIYMALANGCSTIRTGPLSNHTRTAIHVAEIMTGAKFDITCGEGGETVIRCEGICQRNQFL